MRTLLEFYLKGTLISCISTRAIALQIPKLEAIRLMRH